MLLVGEARPGMSPQQIAENDKASYRADDCQVLPAFVADVFVELTVQKFHRHFHRVLKLARVFHRKALFAKTRRSEQDQT